MCEPSPRKLAEFLLAAMKPMVRRDGLLCFRLRQTARGLIQEGVSHRYTLIALLGIKRAQSAGLVFDSEQIVSATQLAQSCGWLTNLGDLGLLLWAIAVADPAATRETFDKLLGSELKHERKLRETHTMELAWLLAGLALAKAELAQADSLRRLAFAVFELIRKNQGPSCLFGHVGSKSGLSGRIRGRIGSFADQVYPIYALSVFGTAFGVPEATQAAVRAAHAMCRLQGRHGQWWWHYDSAGGGIVATYPVHSVHQYGMAPMALLEVMRSANCDFSVELEKGIAWTFGRNELGRSMQDKDAGLIWRGVYGCSYDAYIAAFKHYAKLPVGSTELSKDHLRVRMECRPYEPGWGLYTICGQQMGVR